MGRSLTTSDYQALAELRHQIRKFLYFSEQAARRAGLEPRQHQLMLSLKGLPQGVRPSIGELAERLLIQHHSAVELVNRLEHRGAIARHSGQEDKREVWIRLTAAGRTLLQKLALAHRNELEQLLQTTGVFHRRLRTTRSKPWSCVTSSRRGIATEVAIFRPRYAADDQVASSSSPGSVCAGSGVCSGILMSPL